MKLNKWTVALATTGVVSLASALQADEHPVNTALAATTLSGYVDTSAIWGLGTGDRVANRFANTGADRVDGFNVNTIKLMLEKPIDEGTWSAGYKFETMFGPDANVMPGALASGIAIKQGYVALRAPVGNGLDFKIGQFDPIVGYEVTDSYANPNFSRSFGFNNLEPFGHTGILATYQFNEIVGAAAGIANGDNGFGLNGGSLTAAGHNSGQVGGSGRGNLAESSKVYMASVVLKAPESTGWFAGSSLYLGVVNGTRSGAKNDPTLMYIGGTMATPIKELTFGASADLLLNAQDSFGQKSYGNAYAFYTSYQLTDKIKLNNRFEYANSGYGAYSVANGATTGAPGADDEVIGETLTVDYMLWANVVTRAEFRWDRAVDGSTPFGSAANPQKNNFSLAINVIYKF
jgi:hypothetical protein